MATPLLPGCLVPDNKEPSELRKEQVIFVAQDKPSQQAGSGSDGPAAAAAAASLLVPAGQPTMAAEVEAVDLCNSISQDSGSEGISSADDESGADPHPAADVPVAVTARGCSPVSCIDLCSSSSDEDGIEADSTQHHRHAEPQAATALAVQRRAPSRGAGAAQQPQRCTPAAVAVQPEPEAPLAAPPALARTAAAAADVGQPAGKQASEAVAAASSAELAGSTSCGSEEVASDDGSSSSSGEEEEEEEEEEEQQQQQQSGRAQEEVEMGEDGAGGEDVDTAANVAHSGRPGAGSGNAAGLAGPTAQQQGNGVKEAGRVATSEAVAAAATAATAAAADDCSAEAGAPVVDVMEWEAEQVPAAAEKASVQADPVLGSSSSAHAGRCTHVAPPQAGGQLAQAQHPVDASPAHGGAAGAEDEHASQQAVQAVTEALLAACEGRQAPGVPADDNGSQQQQHGQQPAPPPMCQADAPAADAPKPAAVATAAATAAAAAAAAAAAGGSTAAGARLKRKASLGAAARPRGKAGQGAAAAAGAAAEAPAAEEEEEEDDGMPDSSDAAAMLTWLRERIPQELLDQYREPHTITEEEKATMQERLAVYEAEEQTAKRTRRVEKKFDLNAASVMPTLHPEWGLWEPTWGHKPCAYPGQRFAGRGALKAVGIHGNYYVGIHASGKAPAYAVCLSGGYQDDSDHGDWLWYTGKGGRGDNLTQAKDQSFESENEAIRACIKQRKPLRVCRAMFVTETVVNPRTGRQRVIKRKEYTYDGLYAVIKAGLYDSDNGRAKVCKFLLVGIPGHYKANRAVSFVELRGFRNVQLAGDSSGESDGDEGESGEAESDEADSLSADVRAAKRRRTSRTGVKTVPAAAAAAAAAVPTCKQKQPAKKQQKQQKQQKQKAKQQVAVQPLVVQDARWAAAQRRRRGFVTLDVSGGREARMIPAFNEVDDAPLDKLEYVRVSQLGSEEARQLAAAARAVMPSRWCGFQRGFKRQGQSAGMWSKAGLLNRTCYCGLWECCGSECEERTKCQRNRVISAHGVTQPLEVFRTASKGWGVRCAVDLQPGTFICTYEGDIITHEEALGRRDADSYLFDLDHFLNMHMDGSLQPSERASLPPLHADAADDSNYLVVDALRKGNIARFVNHSCEPNLLVQPVLRAGDSGLLYGVALVVGTKPVPAGEELTYNYAYEIGSTDKEVACHCGARKCKGRLI